MTISTLRNNDNNNLTIRSASTLVSLPLHHPSAGASLTPPVSKPLLLFSARLCQSAVAGKQSKVDRSLYPELLEKDLEEKAIKGWGPGGQSVNKTSSACFLRHIPTGLFVKIHEHRALQQNRKSARKLLRDKLDQHLNGDRAVLAQQEELQQAKEGKSRAKRSRREDMKQRWLDTRQEEARQGQAEVHDECHKQGNDSK